MNLSFVTTCVSANGDDISEMANLSDDVSSWTFIHKIAKEGGFDKEILSMLGYELWSQQVKRSPHALFCNDWAVSCHSSLYQGIPCYYIRHSAIEYIFINSEDTSKILSQDSSVERQDSIAQLNCQWSELSNNQDPVEQRIAVLKNFVNSCLETIIEHRIPVHSVLDYGYDADLLKLAVKIEAAIADASSDIPELKSVIDQLKLQGRTRTMTP